MDRTLMITSKIKPFDSYCARGATRGSGTVHLVKIKKHKKRFCHFLSVVYLCLGSWSRFVHLRSLNVDLMAP